MYSKEDVRKAMKFISLMLIGGYRDEAQAHADLDKIEDEELRKATLAYVAAATDTLMMMKILGV